MIGAGTRADPYRPPAGWEQVVNLKHHGGGVLAVGADATPVPRGAQELMLAPRLGGLALDALWNLLTRNTQHPLMPTMQGTLTLWAQGEPLRQLYVEPTDPEWEAVLGRERLNYAQQRFETQQGLHLPGHHLRCLDMKLEKYARLNLDYRAIQDALPDEEPLRHGTTITESFNTTDGDTLGPDLTWTETAGDIDIVSNAASQQTTGTDVFARAEHDLAGDDHYAQADISALTVDGWAAVMVRFAGAANTGYCAYIINDGGTTRTEMYEITAGSFGAAQQSTAQTLSLPDTIYIQANGSDMTCKFNGSASGGTFTDTSITGNTRTGITGYTNGANKVQWDAFEAADLAAGGGRIMGAIAGRGGLAGHGGIAGRGGGIAG